MEFVITEELKALPTEAQLLDLIKGKDFNNQIGISNTTMNWYKIEKAKWDVKFDSSMSFDAFLDFAGKHRANILYAIQPFTPNDFYIFEDDLWEMCSSDYEGVYINNVIKSLNKYHKLPDGEETARHLLRKDTGAILSYNESVAKSNISEYAKSIELYCMVDGRMYKLSKSIDIGEYLLDIESKIRQVHQEVVDEVDVIMNREDEEKEPEVPQNPDDDEFAVEEPVTNIFVQNVTSEE